MLRQEMWSWSASYCPLGDVHLGRAFISGVASGRHGWREQLVLQQFEAELEEAVVSGRCLKQVGDLFHAFWFQGAKELVLAVTEIVKSKARRLKPGQYFVFIGGNHDESKNLEKVSAFQLFAQLLEGMPGVYVVRKDPFELDGTLYVPYNPFKAPAAQLQPYVEEERWFDEVVGHWDLIEIGNAEQLLPFDQLIQITNTVINGHDHNPRLLEWSDAFRILNTGSMQPYSHGEDATGEWYVTLTPAEIAADPDLCRDRFVRVKLAKGETFDPTAIDAVAVTFMRDDQTEEDRVVDIDAIFDMGQVFNEAFAAVDPLTRDAVKQMLAEARGV